MANIKGWKHPHLNRVNYNWSLSLCGGKSFYVEHYCGCYRKCCTESHCRKRLIWIIEFTVFIVNVFLSLRWFRQALKRALLLSVDPIKIFEMSPFFTLSHPLSLFPTLNTYFNILLPHGWMFNLSIQLLQVFFGGGCKEKRYKRRMNLNRIILIR